MSHIVEIKTEVRDAVAIQAACHRLKLDAPVQGTARLFTTQATGMLVQFPGWKFPAVFNTASGVPTNHQWQTEPDDCRGAVAHCRHPDRAGENVRCH